MYSHLLRVLPERPLLPHETPSYKLRRLFVDDPRSLIAHLSKRTQEINDKLYVFAKLIMHAPQWEDKLKEIIDVR